VTDTAESHGLPGKWQHNHLSTSSYWSLLVPKLSLVSRLNLSYEIAVSLDSNWPLFVLLGGREAVLEKHIDYICVCVCVCQCWHNVEKVWSDSVNENQFETTVCAELLSIVTLSLFLCTFSWIILMRWFNCVTPQRRFPILSGDERSLSAPEA